MRVLYWTEAFPPSLGGTEVLSATLVEGLARRGADIAVVTDRGELPDCAEHRGVPVHRLPFWEAVSGRDPGRMIEVRRRVEALKRSFAPDVIHVNAVGPSLFFHLRTQAAHPAPWLFTPHAPLVDPLMRGNEILTEAFRTAERVACLSRAQLEQILSFAPDAADRASIVYCGLPAPPDEPTAAPAEPRLLFVGRLVPEKGVDVVLDATARLLERVPGVRLTIVGEGPLREDLERQAAALGLNGAARFVGRVPAVDSYFADAALVLMPSRWQETFGLVALETALHGRPIVVSRVGALPEVVLDGETGLVVDSEDPSALAIAAASLLERPQESRRMGRAARRRALDTFGLERCLDGYEALYQRLMNGRR